MIWSTLLSEVIILSQYLLRSGLLWLLYWYLCRWANCSGVMHVHCAFLSLLGELGVLTGFLFTLKHNQLNQTESIIVMVTYSCCCCCCFHSPPFDHWLSPAVAVHHIHLLKYREMTEINFLLSIIIIWVWCKIINFGLNWGLIRSCEEWLVKSSCSIIAVSSNKIINDQKWLETEEEAQH